jgi:transcriptional regulator with XRE-family HTH domain
MEKSVFTPHYDAFRARLVILRKAAGLTQRQLAERVKRPRSFVSRIEQGERRLDVIEFYWICRACRVSPEKTAAEVMRECAKLDMTKRRS